MSLKNEQTLAVRVPDVVDKSTHFVIIGNRGEGKSALGYRLLELHKDKRPCFIYRHPAPHKLPTWIQNVTKVEMLPFGAVCLCDEAGMDWDQYSYAKRTNIYLKNVLTIARHKLQSFIFVTTTTSFLNRNFIFMVDVYLLKAPSLFQLVEERKVVRAAYMMVQDMIDLNEFYWYDGKVFLKGEFDKPPWFTDELSKAYSDYEPEKI